MMNDKAEGKTLDVAGQTATKIRPGDYLPRPFAIAIAASIIAHTIIKRHSKNATAHIVARISIDIIPRVVGFMRPPFMPENSTPAR